MSKKLRAFLIDPENKTVTEVEKPEGLEGFYQIMDCRCITAPIILENEDTLFCDDEGLFVENHRYQFTTPDGPTFDFVGKSIVLGTDNEGDSVDAKSSLDEIKAMVRFPENNATRSL